MITETFTTDIEYECWDIVVIDNWMIVVLCNDTNEIHSNWYRYSYVRWMILESDKLNTLEVNDWKVEMILIDVLPLNK